MLVLVVVDRLGGAEEEEARCDACCLRLREQAVTRCCKWKLSPKSLLARLLVEDTVENRVLKGRRAQIRATKTEMQAPETVRPSGFIQVTIQLPRAIISLILNACNAFLTLPA